MVALVAAPPVPLLTHDVFPAIWPGLVLALLLTAASFARRFGRWGGVALGVLALLWLTHNQRAEGGVLLGFDRAHGLVATDLVGLTGLALGMWLLVRGRL
jgi:hypothetical protein